MQTPNDEAGAKTERIMFAVKRRLPEIDVNTYNRVYEAVYEVLSSEDTKRGIFDVSRR